MPEVSFNVGNFQVITVRLEPTDVLGSGTTAWPRLNLRFQIQLLPARDQQAEFNYVLLRLAGQLETPAFGQFAEFDVGPIVEESRANPYFRQLNVNVDLDHVRIRQFEDARAGRDVQLNVRFSGLAWLSEEQKFQTVLSSGLLQIIVPRSHWADQVLSRWGLSDVKIIEIAFPKSGVGDNFRAAYSHVEAAEKLFSNGQYKQVLGEVYACFEGLANALGFKNPDQQFFASILVELHPEKKEKAKLALDYFCEFAHLGRHEPKTSPETFELSRSDARFALTTALAVLEYITPKG